MTFIKLLLLVFFNQCGQSSQTQNNSDYERSTTVEPGAWRLEEYLTLLKDRNIAVVANHTSRVHRKHLVDTLLNLGVNISLVFTPEHGFRGTAGAGEKVKSDNDPKTGLPVVSLYGNKLRPEKHDLIEIDLVIFDLQDVGVRFYTYISTMTYMMEACAENDISMIVLDRPNPNGDYVDGPVLEEEFRSFVGLHPVPVVYGMTIGEYALMVNGEGWLESETVCDLTVVECAGYDHYTTYDLPVNPSPNLPDMESIFLYPSLCFFEGTIVSVGRGTDKPFRIIGHPDYGPGSYTFVPESKPGAPNPRYEGQQCFGLNLTAFAQTDLQQNKRIYLKWLVGFHDFFRQRDVDFFNDYFDLLAGNSVLREMILEGKQEDEIRNSWKDDLRKFSQIRKNYLIYPDFE